MEMKILDIRDETDMRACFEDEDFDSSRRWVELQLDVKTKELKFLNMIFSSGKHILFGEENNPNWKVVWDENMVLIKNDEKNGILTTAIGIDLADDVPAFIEGMEDGEDVRIDVHYTSSDKFKVSILLRREYGDMETYTMVREGGDLTETMVSSDDNDKAVMIGADQLTDHGGGVHALSGFEL